MSAHPLSTTVALALANHLWQSTLVLGIVALLTLALRQTSARIRYWLWLTASIKFLIPFSLLIALGGHLASLRPVPQRHAPASTASLLAIDQFSQPFTLEALPTQTTQTAAPEPSIATRAAALWNRNPLIPTTLALLWLAGFLIVITRWAKRWWRISSAIRRTHPLHDGHELETLRRMERLAGLRSTIEMKSLPASMEPGIFGLIRPVLLWPQAITERLQAAHLEAVLAHEVCHVQRRDNLTAGLHMVVEAIFWFHPLVWWLETRLIEEREHACDETVLQLCGQRRIYAESILKVCEFCVESPLACVSGVTGADLKKRIVQIMTDRTVLKLTLAKKLLLTATALLVVAVPIVLGQTKSARRMMLATIKPLPMPIRALASGLIAASEKPAPQETPVAESAEAITDPCVVHDGARFDVVSIRASKAGIGDLDADSTADALTASGSVLHLIEEFFGLRQFQITGGPDWLTTQTFDINAKFDDPDKGTDAAGRKAEALKWKQREQRLLAERFHLKCHMTTQQLPVYNLVLAKGGVKLSLATAEESKGTSISSHGDANGMRAVGSGVTTQDLAKMLERISGHNVIVDKTGLTGKYDFTLTWKPESRSGTSDTGSGTPEPELPIALEEQLGIKLVPAKGPVPVLVIDSADKPSIDGAEVAQPPAPQSPVSDKPVPLAPMAKDANPSFEVATIRPSMPSNSNQGFHLRGHRVFLENEPVTSLISVAYGIHKTQIIGAPAWFDTDPYDIDGVPDAPGVPSFHQQQIMIQKILADRFGIKFHREKRELSVYAVTIAKGGIKMTPNTTDPEGQPDETGNGHGSQMTMKFTNSTMADFALNMQFAVGKPVIDQTGLTGRYDYTLTFTTNDAHLDDPNAAPTFFTAIQEQLGLKLEPKKDQADVLVIDHAERPSEN